MSNHPTVIVILGGTGDLAKTKLIPAFFDLFCAGYLPDDFVILGISRKILTNEEFAHLVSESIRKRVGVSNDDIRAFLSHLRFLQGALDVPTDYELLSRELHRMDTTRGVCMNKLFYLATQPTLYASIFENLAHSGLSVGCAHHNEGWVRIVVEKPFGNDLSTAIQLDEMLGLLFKEEQIFRMDHYLAKESLENILAFRFANSLFEPLWSNEHIARIEVKLLESKGIEGREGFFDAVGQLKDVGQNHVLQMLAVTVMDNPQALTAAAVRSARAQVLGSLTYSADSLLIKGQYKGYKSNADETSSTTDTYFKIQAEIDSPRWRGVPIILESGKALDRDEVAIEVVFKEKDTFLIDTTDTIFVQNRVIFRIQPNPAIIVRFWTKKPGYAMDIAPQDAVFPILQQTTTRVRDAYEKILLDALTGDQMLFASSKEVHDAWTFIAPILTTWKDIAPIEYERGAHPGSITHS